MLKLFDRETIFQVFQPICDHGTWTLQTDRCMNGQTDTVGQTTCCGITVLCVDCVASRGKMMTISFDRFYRLYVRYS